MQAGNNPASTGGSNFISSLLSDTTGHFLSNIITKSTGSIMRRGLSHAGSRLAIKLFGHGGGKALMHSTRAIGKAAPWLMAAYTAYGGFQGYKDAARITGKREEDLTVTDRVAATSAGVASAATLGLIDAKTFNEWGQQIGEGIGDAIYR